MEYSYYWRVDRLYDMFLVLTIISRYRQCMELLVIMILAIWGGGAKC